MTFGKPLYRALKAVDKYALAATFEEIAENCVSLNIPRCGDTYSRHRRLKGYLKEPDL